MILVVITVFVSGIVLLFKAYNDSKIQYEAELLREYKALMNSFQCSKPAFENYGNYVVSVSINVRELGNSFITLYPIVSDQGNVGFDFKQLSPKRINNSTTLFIYFAGLDTTFYYEIYYSDLIPQEWDTNKVCIRMGTLSNKVEDLISLFERNGNNKILRKSDYYVSQFELHKKNVENLYLAAKLSKVIRKLILSSVNFDT